jgi:hypothetical protein
MRRHKLGLDEANRTIVVSRAMRRELLSRGTQKITPLEAIHRLTSKLSLDNILYESGEDDSDDDGQNEILPLKMPHVSRMPSSSSVDLSSSSSTTSSNTTNHSSTSTNSRKNARGKSPRKRNKVNNNNNNSNNGNSVLVGRKRSIEDMDPTKQNSEVETKAATGRPQLRASKRLHRSAASTEASVSSGLNANK